MLATENILIHYAEIATKGKNRHLFVDRLVANIRRALTGLPVASVDRPSGRLWVRAKPGCSLGVEAHDRLRTVFGVSSFSPAVATSLALDAIKAQAWQLLEHRAYGSFRVSARRAFKDLPYTSPQLNEEVGAFILGHRKTPVKMKGADVAVHIEVLPRGAYLYVDKIAGLGGLPSGVSGRGMVLLSGGIDSPVAAYRMQKRGLHLSFVHFHSHPFHTRASQEKALDLVQHLVRHQGGCVLYLVPFGELQRIVVAHAPERLRVVLYRRLMLRLAARLARRERARVLITGEAVGQVASQTLANLVAIDSAVRMPVLRPLIGFDKQEIVDQALALGTYETSIVPDQDCCQLFMPPSPETRARPLDVARAEEAFDGEALATEALQRAERHTVVAPWLRQDRSS